MNQRLLLTFFISLVLLPVRAQNTVKVQIDDSKSVYNSRDNARRQPLPLRAEFDSAFTPVADSLLKVLLFSRNQPAGVRLLDELSKADLTQSRYSLLITELFPENYKQGFSRFTEEKSGPDKLRVDNGIPYISVEVNGKQQTAAFDLSNRASYLSKPFQQHRKSQSDPSTVTLEKIKIGNVVYHRPEFRVAGSDRDEHRADLVLGYGLLKDLKLVLDAQHYRYEAVISEASSNKRTNLIYAEKPLIKVHDGKGNTEFLTLDLQNEKTGIYSSGGKNQDSAFYLDDVKVTVPLLSQAKNKASLLFPVSGVVGGNTLSGRKMRIDFPAKRFDLYPAKNYLENGIYLVSGTVQSGKKAHFEELNTSTVEVVSYASVFTYGSPSAQEYDIVVFTDKFIPVELNQPPVEIENPGGFNHIKLEFSKETTRRLKRFTERHIGRNLVFVAGGKAVTMQQIMEPYEENYVEITRCSPEAVEFLYLHLRGNTVNK